MKIENRVIVRRLVAGILLIILALYTFYRSYVFSTVPEKYNAIMDTELKNEMNGNSNALFVFGILILTIGIIFSLTSNKRPHKWIENSLALAFVLISMACGILAGGVVAPISKQLSVLAFFLVILGLTWSKKGFKGMPFIKKGEAVVEAKTNPAVPTEVSNKQATIKGSSTELRELKKLLDDGILTQEEFDAKKKKILGL